MNLAKKKALAARTLGVGKGRIIFNNNRIEEIKEAITKQDIRDLASSGAISVRQITGRAKVVRRKSRRGAGKVRKKINNKKRKYMDLTRRLRGHLFSLRDKKQIAREDYLKLRKEIRASDFRDMSHFKERIGAIK